MRKDAETVLEVLNCSTASQISISAASASLHRLISAVERGQDAETEKIERGTEILRLRARLAAVEAHAEILARVERAARILVDYHTDFLGLPVLSNENLDAAVEQWAELRAALAAAASTSEQSVSDARPGR